MMSAGAIATALMLRNNNTLEHLNLAGNRFGHTYGHPLGVQLGEA